MKIDFALARYNGQRFIPWYVSGDLVEIESLADIATFAVAKEPVKELGRWWSVYIIETGAQFGPGCTTKRRAIHWAQTYIMEPDVRSKIKKHIKAGDPFVEQP
jgi:hypothetical protein